MIVNLIADIDETTTAIPGTKTVVLGTSEVDCNTSVSVGIKETTVSTKPCGLCNCTNNESVFRTVGHAAENQLQHRVNGIFEVIPKDPPVQEPPPEPPPAEPPPHKGTHGWPQLLSNETTIIMNGEIAIHLIAE